MAIDDERHLYVAWLSRGRLKLGDLDLDLDLDLVRVRVRVRVRVGLGLRLGLGLDLLAAPRRRDILGKRQAERLALGLVDQVPSRG